MYTNNFPLLFLHITICTIFVVVIVVVILKENEEFTVQDVVSTIDKTHHSLDDKEQHEKRVLEYLLERTKGKRPWAIIAELIFPTISLFAR